MADAERGENGAGGGGRPRNDAGELARKHGADCVAVLWEIVKSKTKGVRVRDRIEAARILLAYAYGQPRQFLEISTPEGAERVQALEAALAKAVGLDTDEDGD